MKIIDSPPNKTHELPPERIGKLHELIAELLRVNQQMNLTSIRDAETAWIKHVVDSLQALSLDLFEKSLKIVDVGAGPGFPGLPLALARPELKLTFLEATRKKCDFIAATAALLDLKVKIISDRAEVVGQNVVWRERYDMATARAVGSLNEVAELCLPLVKVGGCVVLWRGEQAVEEVQKAQKALQRLGGKAVTVAGYQLPQHDTHYHLVVIEKIARTPAQFPRRTGLPKQQPL